MTDKKIGGHILPERMDRFTWHEGEIKILGTKSAVEEQAKNEGRKITWYDNVSKKISKKTTLYGAIIGDIVGSRFEGRGKKIKKKDFDFFAPKCRFTDDTVMTVAVAEVFLQLCGDAIGMNILDSSTEKLAKTMQRWGRKYPHGYGGRFKEWLFSDNPRPYGSFGNGSAMRVSAAGWLFDSMFDTREVARYSSLPTHNHPDGVRGAEAVASAIFLARQGKSKQEIKSYLEYEFDYDLSRSLEDVRKTCVFNETCPISVPEAIIAFLESTDFEDAIRNAVSLGGDSDTQAAIAGSIAEAFYLIPDHLIAKCREYLPQDILAVVDKFNLFVGWFCDDLENQPLEKKIIAYLNLPSHQNLEIVKDELLAMLKSNCDNHNTLIGFFTVMSENVIDSRQSWEPDFVSKNGNDYEVFYTNINEVIKRDFCNDNFQLSVTEIKENFRIFKFT